MRIPAVSALLIAALSSGVAASPADKETTARVSYTASDQVVPRDPDGWVEIADPTPAKHGKVFIPVGAGAGTFTRVRIDADKGKPVVQSVRIDFKHGPSRVVRVGKKLRKGSSAYVDLRGAREINQVVVTTDRSSRGTYTVSADPGDGLTASR